MLKISGGKVITDTSVEFTNVYIENGIIQAVTEDDLPFDELIDADGKYVSPGFIDTHVHGGGGFDFTDTDVESIQNILEIHFKHGTTTILPTLCSKRLPVLGDSIELIRKVADKDGVPHIPGVHLEGPYLAEAQSGGIAPECMTAPIESEYSRFFAKHGDFIKKVTFAPELPGAHAFFDFLKNRGIIATAGHTEADIDIIADFRKNGLNMFTHLYSSMSTITRRDGYRILGTVEAAYYFSDMYTEVIADGIHLPPRLLELIYRFRGADRICLITDAIRGAEVPEKLLPMLRDKYNCIIEDGIGKMPGKNCFAGSIATTDRLVREMRPIAGIVDTVKMLTKTPAVSHGLTGKGEIHRGFDADLLIFDENINIQKIIMRKQNNTVIY